MYQVSPEHRQSMLRDIDERLRKLQENLPGLNEARSILTVRSLQAEDLMERAIINKALAEVNRRVLARRVRIVCLQDMQRKLLANRDSDKDPDRTSQPAPSPDHDEVLRLREALKNILKPGYGIQGIAEDYGHDQNAYNYHAMLYWKERTEQKQAIARAALESNK